MKIQKLLTIYIPVVLSIIYIIFIALLSFDVFRIDASISQKIGGFIIENIPTILILLALYLALKKPMAGGAMFIVMSIIFTLFFKTYQRWDAFVLVSAPLIIIGGLFLLNRNEYNQRS